MASKSSRSFAAFDNEEYLPLDKLQAVLSRELTHEDGTFTLCFWMYLLKGNRHGPIILQSTSTIHLPFLSFDPEFHLVLHPLLLGDPREFESSSLVSDQCFPAEKWVHIGCEVGHSIARLHIDGVVTGEKTIIFPSSRAASEPLVLFGGDGYDCASSIQAFAHHVCVLPQPSVTNHYVKNPPLELTLDGSTGGSEDHEVEEGGDGVWSVVGGKASCRRNFALDVVLLDALGRAIHKDIELVASLVYADTGYVVEKPKDDAEAPLLTTFDGVEFPSTERPIKLVHGRASFKLKISQLSSKCDNRLFRVCFESPSAPKYPFLRVFSRPIRCVSRNRNSRAASVPWKRAIISSAAAATDASNSPAAQASEDNKNSKAETSSRATECNGGAAPKFISPSKYQRIASDERYPTKFDTPAGSRAPAANAEATGAATGVPMKPDTVPLSMRPVPLPVPANFSWPGRRELRGEDRQLQQQLLQQQQEQQQQLQQQEQQPPSGFGSSSFPDILVFKYCLETIQSRAGFLRALINLNKSDEELHEFAARVSHYTGCHHNGYQVLIAKRLLGEGEELWRQVCKEGPLASWTSLITKLGESFCNITGQNTRRFTVKDCEFMRQISGSAGDVIAREQFERLWQWVFPVAMAIANPQVRQTWESLSPKWIQGMISRKDSEQLLLLAANPQEASAAAPAGAATAGKPGAFVLRFAGSRFWPHPDAGALVVSYIGHDLKINHRLLNIDARTWSSETDGTPLPLSELLLSQPELSTPLSVQHALNNSSSSS